ncbi:amidase [Paracraurococcus ruber]|uniref:Amidase n=1 Tax=Paracraurococcus ruber TaxID=77675 RepID=A0ABS1CU50_9PROT|nr:amidase [Paracraurococcus ruber]MBK1657527.1 amidase [Paracraurococcus ruber]TDG34079.1 amidase [Paracraurococcus ruber]
MGSELWQLDATDLARLIRAGRASATEATRACLDRLAAVNPAINAVVQEMPEEALAEAAAADAAQARGEALGPLHGVPVTIKVNVDQRGHATTNGVAAFQDKIAAEDSPVVANLRAAGAIIIGRTNAPAFSMRLMTDNAVHGRTLNPRDPAITPGGSSGGAGAAVAAGIGPIAHGNDIGGSVRIPAYCCGVVGLRTGFGRVAAFSTQGMVGRPLSSQIMSTQGPLARSVRDLRLALAVMARGDARDTRWADAPLVGPPPKRPIRVALVPEVPGGSTHPAQAEAVRQAGRHLAAAGYVVEEALPPSIETAVELWHVLGSTELFPALWPLMERLGDPDGQAAMRTWMELSPPRGLAEFLAALAERDLLLQRWMAFLLDTPLVVLPTLAGLPPPQRLDVTLDGQRAVLESIRAAFVAPLLGLPGCAVPVGHHGRLRPGVQIMAGRFREDLCLDAAEVIEAAEGPILPIDPVAA